MDNDTFTQKVLECEQTLYRISLTMLKNEKDCEDAVQEAILTAYKKLYTLKHNEYFTTWLVRILINQCKKQLRYNNRFSPAESAYIESDDNAYKSIELKTAIESLPSKIRSVIVLYYIEDFTVKEIKSILKIPEGTVKSRLARGRELLKSELK